MQSMRLPNAGITSPLEALDRIQRALDEVRVLAERNRARHVDRTNKQPVQSEASFVERYAVALSKSRPIDNDVADNSPLPDALPPIS